MIASAEKFISNRIEAHRGFLCVYGAVGTIQTLTDGPVNPAFPYLTKKWPCSAKRSMT
jgi:hypothetical protein